MIPKKLIPLVLNMFALSSFLGLFFAQAENFFPQIRDIQFLDLNDNGLPDLAVIRTAFVSNDDVIYVYDQNNDMIASSDWKESCDFEEDVWIFDTGGDGSAELIIDFAKEKEAQVAYLYDDFDGDGKVSYNIINGTFVEVVESSYWKLKVVGRDGVWEEAGRMNFNISIFGDGDIEFLNVPPEMQGVIQHDGIIDLKIEIWDLNNDGIPDYEIRSPFEPKPEELGVLLTVNNEDSPVVVENSIFWWLLGIADGHSWNRRYHETLPPIQVNWKEAKIETVVEIIPSRGGENNYFFFGEMIHKGKPNFMNAEENPFAFYDLARDNDGYPELIVRMVSFVDETGQPSYGMVRYTWDQNNDANADYGILLVGKNYFDSLVEYPGFSIAHLPYQELPNWIYNVNRTWNLAVFTAAEGVYQGLGEGIYENFLFAGKASGKFLFYKPNVTISLPPYIPNKIGTRAEYTYNMYGVSPRLYYSPIDNKLHLKNAKEGIWIISAEPAKETYGPSDFTKQELLTGNISTIKKIEYKNLDGDRYIDQWIYYEGNTPKKCLIYHQGYLIYADPQKIKILKVDIRESLFEITPPRTYDEWINVARALNRSENLNPTDFEAMFNRFSGELVELYGAKLEDYRLLLQGFRMILEFSENVSINSDINLTVRDTVASGNFILLFDGNFTLMKWFAPTLSISDVTFDKEAPKELEHIRITCKIQNDGWKDVSPVEVKFYEGYPKKGGTLIAKKIVSVPQNSYILVTAKWTPMNVARYNVVVVINAENAKPETEVTVGVVSKTLDVLSLSQQTMFPVLHPVLFLTISLAIIIALFSFPYIFRMEET